MNESFNFDFDHEYESFFEGSNLILYFLWNLIILKLYSYYAIYVCASCPVPLVKDK